MSQNPGQLIVRQSEIEKAQVDVDDPLAGAGGIRLRVVAQHKFPGDGAASLRGQALSDAVDALAARIVGVQAQGAVPGRARRGR